MAAFTILEAILGFLLTMVADVFALIPIHNAITSTILGSGLVVSNLDYQVINVIAFCILSVPIAAIIFTGIYAFNEITYKAGGGI